MSRSSTFVIVLLGFVIAVAPVATAVAQPGGSPAAPQSAPANPAGAPGASDAPPTPPSGNDEKADNPPANAAPERASETAAPRNEAATSPANPSADLGAASPRSEEGKTTRILGLGVFPATLITGALLLAVVLMIGARRRRDTGYTLSRRDSLP